MELQFFFRSNKIAGDALPSARISAVALFCAVFILSCVSTYAQTTDKPAADAPATGKKPAPNLPTLQQTIVVSAHFTPEEKEDDRLNGLYQPIYKMQQQHDCAGTLEQLRTVIIPAAEGSQFNVPRNKFLFLSYTGIADCDAAGGQFAEADQMYQKSLKFLPIWPGFNDSAYPRILCSIGITRLDRADWKGAQEPLEKADKVFSELIDKNAGANAESGSWRSEEINNLQRTHVTDLDYLAAAYFKDDRAKDSLALLERAYAEAKKCCSAQPVLQAIIRDGLAASLMTGDTEAQKLWTERENIVGNNAPPH